MINLHTGRVFRNTPNVRFFDLTLEGSNGLDLVEHEGRSVSPPNDELDVPHWYVHAHQTDNNRVLRGRRLFELFFPVWEQPHWFVLLTPESGALEIPPGCLHRSYSGTIGSLLINQAIRTEGYNEKTEFKPVPTTRFLLSKLNSPAYHGITQYEKDFFIKWGRLP